MSDVMTSNGGPYREPAGPTPPTEVTKPLTLQERMVEIRRRAGYVQKDKRMEMGGGKGYGYASAEAVLGKVRELADEMGVATATNVALVQYQVDEGTTRCAVHIRLAFTLGKDAIVFEGLGGGQDRGDKAVMKANTAALKYALASGLLLSWGDDPEADASTPTDGTPANKRPSARRGRVPADPAKAAEAVLVAELVLRTSAASSMEDLAAIKTDIQTKIPQGTDTYKKLVEGFMARRKEITAKETA